MQQLESSQSSEGDSIDTDTCDVFGLPYRVSDMASATDAVVARALSGEGGYACLAGVHGIITAQHRPELRRAMEESWANLPDGEPVAWMMRRLGARSTRRVAGPDLMPNVIAAGQDVGLRHYLFGSTPEVLERLERRIKEAYPRAHIVGTMSPPFRPLSEHEEAAITTTIRSSGAQIVWVGLGLPKQDEWMCRNAERLRPCLAMGVGAAFDFLAGTKKRAPMWMQRAGLEWMHRMGSEPRRLGRRYVATNSEFVARAAAGLVGHWRESAGNAIRGRQG
jgi:N-acetylglucosaminyldiphosphoundecaprenol N-acetyl-beta-D-mannosaminyltransferase